MFFGAFDLLFSRLSFFLERSVFPLSGCIFVIVSGLVAAFILVSLTGPLALAQDTLVLGSPEAIYNSTDAFRIDAETLVLYSNNGTTGVWATADLNGVVLDPVAVGPPLSDQLQAWQVHDGDLWTVQYFDIGRAALDGSFATREYVKAPGVPLKGIWIDPIDEFIYSADPTTSQVIRRHPLDQCLNGTYAVDCLTEVVDLSFGFGGGWMAFDHDSEDPQLYYRASQTGSMYRTRLRSPSAGSSELIMDGLSGFSSGFALDGECKTLFISHQGDQEIQAWGTDNEPLQGFVTLLDEMETFDPVLVTLDGIKYLYYYSASTKTVYRSTITYPECIHPCGNQADELCSPAPPPPPVPVLALAVGATAMVVVSGLGLHGGNWLITLSGVAFGVAVMSFVTLVTDPTNDYLLSIVETDLPANTLTWAMLSGGFAGTGSLMVKLGIWVDKRKKDGNDKASSSNKTETAFESLGTASSAAQISAMDD